ncbi:DUF6588 family protein [Ekhidna sp.]|uniref:DUF6588 family protein n=1 Tax=Ekhidna sp. TaxID=2608089 RepID=UPI003B508FDE
MKNFINRLIIFTFLISSSSILKAQLDLGTFLEAGAGDAENLMESYLEPAFLGFGYGINSGWYNTAKPHKLLGFDITPTTTLALVPSKGEFFTFNPNEYTNISLNPNSPTDQAPTLFGPNLPADELPLLDYTSELNGEEQTISITSPTGLGLEEVIPINAVPSGMIQVGLGVFKNTDLKIRFIPTIEEDDFEFGMFGVGVMHDLKQWVPGFKQIPWDVSGFVGWNNISTKLFLDPDSPDQIASLSISSFTMQGLLSKQLSILTVFGGVGVATTTTNFDLEGTYETEITDDNPSGTYTDPISFKYLSTGPRINVGFRLKLLILTLHADYAIQKYNTLTIGAGISIR